MSETPKYKILKKLEAGGMAEVFCADMESIEGFKKQVAIKRVLPHLSQNREFIAMFLDEARLSLKFSHANIVNTFDIGVADNTYFITMEYVDGLNMKRILDHHKMNNLLMDPFYAAYIVKEMCKGLHYAHSLKDSGGSQLGVVHRDVSPPNILISRQGEVKLVDFGLAKATSQLEHTEPGIIKGKFSYLSPEAAWGKEVDHRADLFSAGIIFWEMIAGGRKLFRGKTDYDTVMIVREANVPPIIDINRAVPRELDDILRKALSADPETRYQSAAEMGRDITNVMFSYRKAISTYDIAGFVENILTREPAATHEEEPDIVDLLIEQELDRVTSIDAPSEAIFTDGSRPISVAEISGLLDTEGGMEDPREWAGELNPGRSGPFPALKNIDERASGWHEVQVHNLGRSRKPSEKNQVPQAAQQPPSFPINLQAEQKIEKKKQGPRYGLWFVLLFLALVGLGAAYYFLIFQK